MILRVTWDPCSHSAFLLAPPPGMALSLLWHKILQVPKPKLSRMRPKHPIWWKSRPVSTQKVSAGPDPWIHGPWVHTTASPLATNQDKWKSKCYTPDCKSNTGREATNSTTNFQHICLCKISLGHRSQGNKSAALRFFSNTSRIQHLSCTLVLLWQWWLSRCLSSTIEAPNCFLGTSLPLPPYLLI